MRYLTKLHNENHFAEKHKYCIPFFRGGMKCTNPLSPKEQDQRCCDVNTQQHAAATTTHSQDQPFD